MATFEFKLPDIGEGVMEGEIVKWLVQEGDAVGEDQPLVEVMTDKATVMIPSPRRGRVVKTFGKEGEIAKVHHPLVTLELDAGAASAGPSKAAPGGDSPARPGPPAAPAQVSTAAESDARNGGAGESKVLATPVTRRIAREHGLKLEDIAGTGPQGRVTKADVMAAISGEGAVATGSETAAPALARGVPAPPLAARAADQRIQLRGLRKKIAEKMVRSKFTAPHYTFVEEMDATPLVELRRRLNERLALSGETLKLSYLPFIMKATVAALRKYPMANANMDEATQEIVVRGEYNLGMAVATGEGLTVAVVHHVDQRSLKDLAQEVSRLAAAAREKKLRLEELTGGTFTITSLGESGGLFATPIINHPEVAILGVHRIRKRPIVTGEGQIAVRDMMHLSLSFDHRVIDGAVGADFTYALIRYLEAPEMLFLEMI
jgi:pyruvate dehydrogenase E2 component (dihydrolipoamide acetyltransferase)